MTTGDFSSTPAGETRAVFAVAAARAAASRTAATAQELDGASRTQTRLQPAAGAFNAAAAAALAHWKEE